MLRRLPIVLGVLGCGVIAIAALWMVMDSSLAAVPKFAAWLGFFVGGAAALLLFIVGVMRNTRGAAAAQQNARAAASRAETAELLRVSADARDTTWELKFYRTVATVALAPAEPAQLTGPDGMPYAAFQLYDNGAMPAQLSLSLAAEMLVAHGFGAMLNPRNDGSADWTFSYGDMLSLRLLGRIVPASNVNNAAAELQTEREVLAGSPSDALLPGEARAVIRKFMHETLGIIKPAVFLISDAAMQPPESLVFNVSGQQLAEGWTEQRALRYLHWFLPQHYRAISVPADSSLARHFQAL